MEGLLNISLQSAKATLSQAIQAASSDNSLEKTQVLEAALIATRLVRIQSEKTCHFWNFSQKAAHAEFDKVYAQGIKSFTDSLNTHAGAHVATKQLNTVNQLAKQAVPKEKLSEDIGSAVKIGIGGGIGLALGDIYSQTLSNLIVHEHGHAWAMEQMWHDPAPATSTNAEHWLKQGEWAKWWNAEREGAPGNWTMGSAHDHAGHGSAEPNQLTPAEQGLVVDAAGLGAELVANTSVAALGLLAIRQKKPALGGMLLACAATSHISAHSYIRRTPELLHTWSDNQGGDPPQIAKDLAEVFGCDPTVAFEFLYYGYLTAPLVILGVLAAIFAKSPQEPVQEAALKRLLQKNPSSQELQTILTEMEIEAKVELACAKANDKEQVSKKMTAKLIDKIRTDKKTASLLKQAEKEITCELKGKLHPIQSHVFRLRLLASASGIASMTLRRLGETLVPVLNQATQIFTGVFIGGQVVCLVLDGIQTWGDLSNKKLNTTAKVISVVRLLLSAIACAAAIAALFVPGLNGIVIGTIVVSVVMRLVLTGIDLRNRKKLMMEEQDKKARKEINAVGSELKAKAA